MSVPHLRRFLPSCHCVEKDSSFTGQSFFSSVDHKLYLSAVQNLDISKTSEIRNDQVPKIYFLHIQKKFSSLFHVGQTVWRTSSSVSSVCRPIIIPSGLDTSWGVWDLQVHISHTVAQRGKVVASQLQGHWFDPEISLLAAWRFVCVLDSFHCPKTCGLSSGCELVCMTTCTCISEFLEQILTRIKRSLKKQDCLTLFISCCCGLVCKAYWCTICSNLNEIKEGDWSCDQYVWGKHKYF